MESPDATMVRKAKAQFKEKRARRNDGGEGVVHEGDGVNNCKENEHVDTDSFPILRIDQLKIASDDLLQRAYKEIPGLLDRLAREDGAAKAQSNPLVKYARRQQEMVEEELQKRAAALRVERLIRGKDVQERYFVKQATESTTPRFSSEAAVEPSPAPAPAARSSVPVEAAWAGARATTTVKKSQRRRPATTDNGVKAASAAAKEAAVEPLPRSTGSARGGGSRYSQAVLEAERKQRLAQASSWGSAFVVPGGKKKKRTNVFARRQKAEALAAKKKRDQLTNLRKLQRTSKNLDAAREMLRLKELRKQERAKRRAILEKLKETQAVAQEALRKEQRQIQEMRQVLDGDNDGDDDGTLDEQYERAKPALAGAQRGDDGVDDGGDRDDADDLHEKELDLKNFHGVSSTDDLDAIQDARVERINNELVRLRELDDVDEIVGEELKQGMKGPLRTPRGWREELEGEEGVVVVENDGGRDMTASKSENSIGKPSAKPVWLQPPSLDTSPGNSPRSPVEVERQDPPQGQSRIPIKLGSTLKPKGDSRHGGVAATEAATETAHRGNALDGPGRCGGTSSIPRASAAKDTPTKVEGRGAAPKAAPSRQRADRKREAQNGRAPGNRERPAQGRPAASNGCDTRQADKETGGSLHVEQPRGDETVSTARRQGSARKGEGTGSAGDDFRPPVTIANARSASPPNPAAVSQETLPLPGPQGARSDAHGEYAIGAPADPASGVHEDPPALPLERTREPIHVEPVVYDGTLPSATELHGMFDDDSDSDSTANNVDAQNVPLGTHADLNDEFEDDEPLMVAPSFDDFSGTVGQETNGAGKGPGPGLPVPTQQVPKRSQHNAQESNAQRSRPEQGKESVKAALPAKKQAPPAPAVAPQSYKGIYDAFIDMFSAIHEAKKSKNIAVDEVACIEHHIKQLEVWNETMKNYLNLFSAGGEIAGPTPGVDPPLSYVAGKYFEVHQCRGRHEVVDIVTRACKERIGKNWYCYPANIGLNARTWNLLWTWSRPRIKYESLFHFQRVNHFPGSRELTRKDTLKINLQRFTQFGGKLAAQFSIMPKTYCLPREYLSFMETFSRVAEEEEEKFPLRPPGSMNWWILKPAGSSRGRGISLLNDIGKVTYGDTAVIQRYLYNPLLLDGYKFDLRLYVLVTSFNPLEVFLYDDGFVRITTVPYSSDPADLHNKFIHLTNSSVQCDNLGAIPQYKGAPTAHSAAVRALMSGMGPSQFRNPSDPHPMDSARPDEFGGSKLKLSYLWRRLREQGVDVEALRRNIEDVVVKTLVAAEEAIPPQVNSFELFGYDILIDEDLKPWLIEVNASPAMACDFQVDKDVKYQLVEDTIRLVNPLSFDREALLEALKQKRDELVTNRLRPYANPTAMFKNHREAVDAKRSELDAVLSKVLQGQVPRRYGEMPEHMGQYKRLAPGTSLYNSAVKLRQKGIASRKQGTTVGRSSRGGAGLGSRKKSSSSWTGGSNGSSSRRRKKR
jgi:hypothetical protein